MNNKLRILIKGKSPENILKEIILRKINIYDLIKKEHKIELIIDEKDYEKIKQIKTTYKISIIEEFGFIKYKHLLKKYIITFICILISILTIIFLSKITFNIEVDHPNQKLVKMVINDLEEFGLRKYHFKISFQEKEKIKTKILEKEKDNIEWLEIEEHGTKYVIKLEERKKNTISSPCNARNVVAKKNAIIKEINATSGEIVKKKNDYVEKGEVIISGLIYNKENIVSKRCAIGKVYGETWYKVKVTIPKQYTIKNKTKNKTFGLSITILKKEYNLFNQYQEYEKNEYNILESKILPIKIAFSKFYELKVKEKTYTTNNVSKKAIELAENKLQKKLNKDDTIIDKKVLKKQVINSRIEVEVFFSVKEDITEYIDITDLNIEEMNIKEE